MADSDVLQDTDIEQEVGTEAEAVLEPPYRVFVHNDDVTPFDFVIIALQQAEQIDFVVDAAGAGLVSLVQAPLPAVGQQR